MIAPEPSVAAMPVPSWAELNRQWLAAAIGRLADRIEAGDAGGSGGEAAVEDRETEFTPALVRCAATFGLSRFERELLLLVAGLELDARLRAAVADKTADRQARASFRLALALLAEPHWDALGPDAPLRFWRMVELEPGHVLAEAPLRIDEHILHFLAGLFASDAQLAGVATLVEARTPDGDEPPLPEAMVRALADPHEPRTVALRCSNGDEAALRDAALAALARLGRPALWIAARDLPADPAAQALLARHVDRQAALSGAVPVLALGAESSESVAAAFAGRLRSAIVWLGSAGESLSSLPAANRVLRFELPPPDARRTRNLLMRKWGRETPLAIAGGEPVRAALARAAEQFHAGPAAVETVIETLRAMPAADRAAAAWGLMREAARGGLDALAQRIDTRVTFDDLVLPPGHMAMLRDISRHLRHRERVYRDWGFGEKHALGQGLVALFAGESGTGKTLAAEAIATAVELDLYRVDLATLVSKYIGETEKNLKSLFDAAETSGAVLLFDEADALFGKRSEVKDSHDRYANIEVAYLLQRIEAYRGLAVLTTNMKSALDRAFLRRIRFVLTFPFPDAAAREEIWRRQFPAEAPLGEIDYAALARLNLAGGNIRSIALGAAFKAADAGAPIDQAILIDAARGEFVKLERPFQEVR
ncbi:MAG TPA: ATP-binding protein [Allosphingosinicella sp.]|nr:ATP-binding protein [Allosphingosinicella sp.]